MKMNKPLSSVDDVKNVVKKILFFASAGTLVFCAISSSPHWTFRLLVSAAALLAMIYELGRSAPVGYQDEGGFHDLSARKARRVRRASLASSLFPPARRPLSA